MGSTFVFCTVDQRNLVYMHTGPNVYASWVVPPSGATRATVSTGRLNYFSNPSALQGTPFSAKARPTAYNCGWRQQGHAAIKYLHQQNPHDDAK